MEKYEGSRRGFYTQGQGLHYQPTDGRDRQDRQPEGRVTLRSLLPPPASAPIMVHPHARRRQSRRSHRKFLSR